MNEQSQKPDAPVSTTQTFRETVRALSEVLRRLGPASFMALATALLPLIGLALLVRYMDVLGTWLRDNGTTGMVVYVVGFVVLSGLALVPTHASAILGGWAFGFWTGLPLALIGFVGGALVSYAIVRPTASGRVEALIAEKPKWKAVHDALVRGSPWRVLAIVILIRMPASAFAATNLVLASVRVPIALYTLGTLIGMIPRTVLVIAIAAKARDLASADSTPTWAWILGIVVTMAVFGVLGVIANKAVAKVTQLPKDTPAKPAGSQGALTSSASPRSET